VVFTGPVPAPNRKRDKGSPEEEEEVIGTYGGYGVKSEFRYLPSDDIRC
jgi:hypothetical protein